MHEARLFHRHGCLRQRAMRFVWHLFAKETWCAQRPVPRCVTPPRVCRHRTGGTVSLHRNIAFQLYEV